MISPAMGITDPSKYEAWYQTRRGRWIAHVEFGLLRRMIDPKAGTSVLDIGCGTGHFSRMFAEGGCRVTGIDTDLAALDFAEKQGGGVKYVSGSAAELPFPPKSFDYCTAVTSLCFVENPASAVSEMLRVSRKVVLLGLLNRHSLLYRDKGGRGSYQGARWDGASDVRKWIDKVEQEYRVSEVVFKSALFLHSASPVARVVERVLPNNLLFGGFLAVKIALCEGGQYCRRHETGDA